jgi:hypothetical protein
MVVLHPRSHVLNLLTAVPTRHLIGMESISSGKDLPEVSLFLRPKGVGHCCIDSRIIARKQATTYKTGIPTSRAAFRQACLMIAKHYHALCGCLDDYQIELNLNLNRVGLIYQLSRGFPILVCRFLRTEGPNSSKHAKWLSCFVIILLQPRHRHERRWYM